MKILYNTEFHRWEVYGDKLVIRAGAEQPCFVSLTYDKCEEYANKAEGTK